MKVTEFPRAPSELSISQIYNYWLVSFYVR